MKLTKLLTTASILAVGTIAAATAVLAQGPLYDKVIVDLPYRVTVNNTVLEPGHYIIRQLDDPGGGSRVLQIFSDNGMKLRTTSLTIPTLDNNTPNSTKIILHHYGNDYYFDKIWIQGKNYGYEFPLPNAVKSRMRERAEPYTVAAKYEPTTKKEEETTVAQNTTPAAPAPPPPAPEQPQQQAQNTPPPPPPAPETPHRMPTTSVGWLTMLCSGGLLTGAGLLLRRVHA